MQCVPKGAVWCMGAKHLYLSSSELWGVLKKSSVLPYVLPRGLNALAALPRRLEKNGRVPLGRIAHNSQLTMSALCGFRIRCDQNRSRPITKHSTGVGKPTLAPATIPEGTHPCSHPEHGS